MNIIKWIDTYARKAKSGLRSFGTRVWQRGSALLKPVRAIGKIGNMPKRWRRGMVAAVIVIVCAGGGAYAADRYIEANTFTLYEVTLGGEALGLVSNPDVIESYIQDRYRLAQEENPDLQMKLDYDPIAFREQAIYQGEAQDPDVLDQLASQIRPYAVGIEIRVDGELLGIVKDQATADELLNQIKGPFDSEPVHDPVSGQVRIASANSAAGNAEANSATNAATNAETNAETNDTRKLLNQQIDFVEEVVEQSVEVQPDQFSDPEELLERIQTGGVQPVSYVVQEGDTIYDIARKYEVENEVIYRNNPWIKNDLLHPGDVLNLTVWQPLLSVQVTKTIEQKEDIPFPIEYVSDPNMLEGQTKVITPGVSGERIVTIEETTINGVLASSHEIKSFVTKEPIAATYLRGTKSVSGLDEVVQKLLGVPYVWGGTTPSGFDCSGFTRYVLAKYGVELPRTSSSQAEAGTQVAKKDLRKGDLVFFHTFGPAGTISHVGIYLGNGKIANALSSKVQINDLNDDYFSKRYITARRVLTDEQYQAIAY